MTLYILHIKSKALKSEALTTFLQLLGYNPVTQDNIKEEITIEFNSIKLAQKVETEFKKMFCCFITQEAEFDKTGMTKVRIVNLTSFKETGKYYDNFNVEIPANTNDFDIIEAILNTHEKLPEYFIYYGHYANNVPFIIPAHIKASDIKPYIKME